MKCVCGYERESGIGPDGKWNDNLKGNEDFITIRGSTFKIWDRSRGYCNEVEVYLYACPKCGTVRMDRW